MKSKKRDREPELIQYRIEFSIEEDLPAERFLMALTPHDALSQLASMCIKNSPFKNLSKEEHDAFASAFSRSKAHDLLPPSLDPVPDPIPDLDIQETEAEIIPEKIEQKNDEENVPEEETEDQLNPFAQTEEVKPSKPDPAAEHRIKQQERLKQISEVEARNKQVLQGYENLVKKTEELTNWLSSRISIIAFEEYNRWIDKWVAIDYPLTEVADNSEAEQD